MTQGHNKVESKILKNKLICLAKKTCFLEIEQPPP